MRRLVLTSNSNLSRLAVYNPKKEIHMDWNKLILLGSVALAVVSVPAAMAQINSRAGASTPRADMAGASAPRSLNVQPGQGSGLANTGRPGNWNTSPGRGSNWRSGDRNGNWRNGDRGRWGNHRHRHWRHRRHYYPYYGYYPFGYGYGYGYPFFGSSASLYYNGYHPRYVSDGRNRGSGSVAVDVQQELARAGYYRGAIDGVIGSGTRSAIRAYERANGLPVDGRIDSDLLGRMGLS